MASNPIKYRDLLEPDDSIKNLRNDLIAVRDVYAEVIQLIKSQASEIQTAMTKASGATREGRKDIEEATASATRLEKAQKELAFAMSETGQKVSVLRTLTSEANKATVARDKALRAEISSYDSLKMKLSEQVSLYKALSSEQRANTTTGGAMLQNILALKDSLAALDSRMKPHIDKLTELEKAEQRLIYIQSKEGQQLLDIRKKIQEELGARKGKVVVLSELEKAQQKLAFAQSEENIQLKLYSTQISEANTLAKAQAIVSNSLEGSYERLSAQYTINKLSLNKMGEATAAEIASKRALEKETLDLYNTMTKLQEATGKHSLSVGNYKKHWDGLGMSVNQIVREIPAAAISLNTFFLAISNNIPILMDEMQKMKVVNAELIAQGKPAQNVTKAVISSLFSFNTIIVVLITVLSMYGKQIFEWIGANLLAIKATDKYASALSRLNAATINANNAQAKGLKDSVALTTRAKLLYAATQDTTKSMNDRLAASKALKKEFPEYFKQLSDEEIIAGKAAKNYNDLAKAIIATSKARAAEEKMIENSKQILDLDNKRIGALTNQVQAQERLNKQRDYYAKATASGVDAKALQDIAGQMADSQEAIKKYGADAVEAANNIEVLRKANENLGKTIAVTDLTREFKEAKEPRNTKDRTERIERDNLRIQQKYAESVTELEEDELVKRRKALIDTYNKETGDLMNKYNNDKDLTEDSRKKIMLTILNYEKKLNTDLENIQLEFQDRELSMLQNTIKLRLDAVKKGSDKEVELKLRAIELERQRAIIANKQLPSGQQLPESVISAGFTKQAMGVLGTEATSSFDQEQALEEALFNMRKRSSYATEKFKLDQQKARIAEQLRQEKEGILDMSETEIATAKATMEGLDRQTKDLGKDRTLLERLGFDDDQIEALQEATNIIVEQFGAILAAEVQLAEQAKAIADERVADAQRALDAEIEARNNGYANSVATARKEQLQARKDQQEKQKLLEEAQRRQEALNTVTQASSLVTASAGLWQSFSGLGPIGPALAIAAIGAMWSSFAVAKIKAKQVTAGSKEYGDGGLEFLDGGSHASGNDIPIGKTRDGRARKAEGGEAMAIINKNKTRRYRRILPDIVKSLNKGTFEDKYLKAFETSSALANVTVAGANIDLSRVEESIEAIRKQGDHTMIVGPNGDIIEKRNNVLRIIKNN